MTVTFTPPMEMATVNVPIINDIAVEGTEYFDILLMSMPDDVMAVRSTVRVSILPDDDDRKLFVCALWMCDAYLCV